VQDAYTVGEGSVTRNGEVVATSERTDPETFGVALVARWGRDRSRLLGAVSETVNERCGDLRRFGSLQATLAFVASGEIEAAVTTEPTTPWDTLAGVGLIRAAGGTVTGLDGDPWTLDSNGLVATNGEAHEAVLDAVTEAVAATAR
jgi:myo-inositol-1(or 4)-monophosphatase